MANIKIDPQQAISYGNQIIENSQNYKTQIDKLYQIVSDLRNTWTGSAAQSFADNIGKYETDYKKFGELINNFGELLVAIGKDYQKVESELEIR